MNKLLNLIEKLSYFGFVPAIALIFMLMLLNFASVVTRYAGVPISGVTNIGEFTLVGLVFLSLAYVQRRKQNLVVEILVSRLAVKTTRKLEIISVILSLGICLLLVWLTWQHAIQSVSAGERITGAPYYPIYPAKIALALGMSLLGLQLFVDFVRTVFGKEAGTG